MSHNDLLQLADDISQKYLIILFLFNVINLETSFCTRIRFPVIRPSPGSKLRPRIFSQIDFASFYPGNSWERELYVKIPGLICSNLNH